MTMAALDYSSLAGREKISVVLDFYADVIEKRNLCNIDQYLDPGFKQHNPLFGEGVEGFKDSIKAIFHDNLQSLCVDIDVAIAQNDRVFVYTTWRGRLPSGREELPIQVVDIYRVQDGRLTEHWDRIEYAQLKKLGIERPVQRQPGMPLDREGTVWQKLNLGVILGFYHDVCVRDTSRAHLYASEEFWQHYPAIESGLAGLRTDLEGFAQLAPDLSCKLSHVVAGARFVGAIIDSNGHTRDGADFLLLTGDCYQMDSEMITKHWGLTDFTGIETTSSS